jgi:Trypsin
MNWYVLRNTTFLAISFLTLGCQQKNLLDLPSPSSEAVYETQEYPAVVRVILPGGRGLCTGTFVSPRAVLTAAHCTQAAGNYTVTSAFGTFTTSTRVNYGPGEVEDPHDISFLIFSQDVADRSLNQVADLAGSVGAGETLRLIGYGCSSMESRRGSGVKRTGTNMVYDVTDYIQFLTPRSTARAFRGIIGASNRAGACFGDSGGPAVEARGEDETLVVKGVAHTGGTMEDDYLSEHVNITRGDNRAWISGVNNDYNLGIRGL